METDRKWLRKKEQREDIFASRHVAQRMEETEAVDQGLISLRESSSV